MGDCGYAVDSLPDGAYQVRSAGGDACAACVEAQGGYRWRTLGKVHPNCECPVAEEHLEPEHQEDKTCTLDEHEEEEYVATVDQEGSSSVAQTWSTNSSWTVTGSGQVTGEAGPVKVGGTIGGSYGSGSTSGGTTTRTFNYLDDPGGETQHVYAVYKVRTRQDIQIYLYPWTSVVKNSPDESVALKNGAPYTERRFWKYRHKAVD